MAVVDPGNDESEDSEVLSRRHHHPEADEYSSENT